MEAKIPRHIIFIFIRYCILTRLNWGPFVDEDRFETKTLYEEIDTIIAKMIHNVCIPHVIDSDEF
jgi:hypothetical protein